MLQETWGLLGGERLSGTRRTRTLGLGPAVREFNERAVPGLGGIWFGKQVLLATLGIVVAERAKEVGAHVRNIEAANAIEALACWLAFKSSNWAQDRRLRGINKLQTKGADFSFSRVRQRNFYVTQPMRMSSVQALPSLGFATSDGPRFNSYRSTDAGRAFVALACNSFRPYNRDVVDHLVKWVTAGREDVSVDTWQLTQAISPIVSLPEVATKVLMEGLRRDDSMSSRRRANALDWVERVRLNNAKRVSWSVRPADINESHWRDMEAGAKFSAVRDASISVLDAMEVELAAKAGKCAFDLARGTLPATVVDRLDALREMADNYLAMCHEQQEAAKFCQECRGKGRDVLRTLISRDGSVLRLAGNEIVPGAAFSHAAEITGSAQGGLDAPQTSALALPKNISYRVGNLYMLNLDMAGQLDSWLASEHLARAS